MFFYARTVSGPQTSQQLIDPQSNWINWRVARASNLTAILSDFSTVKQWWKSVLLWSLLKFKSYPPHVSYKKNAQIETFKIIFKKTSKCLYPRQPCDRNPELVLLFYRHTVLNHSACLFALGYILNIYIVDNAPVTRAWLKNPKRREAVRQTSCSVTRAHSEPKSTASHESTSSQPRVNPVFCSFFINESRKKIDCRKQKIWIWILIS